MSLIEALGRLGVRRLMIGGGEPLLRPDLPDIVRAAGKLGMETFVASNGSLLDPASARALRDARLSKFFLGMDDPTAPGAKDGTADGYRASLDLLRNLDIAVAVNLILTHDSIECFEQTLRRLKAMGVGHVNLLRPRPDAAGAWLPKARLRPSDLQWLRDVRLELGARYGMSLSLDCALGALLHGTAKPEALASVVACSAGIDYFHMDPAGNVFPCPYLTTPEYSLGHVEDPSFPARWESDPLLMALRDRDRLADKCGACAYRRSCGGCRALALHHQGELFAEDPDCPF